MNEAQIIKNLKLQLLIERITIAVIAFICIAVWTHGRMGNAKSFVLVDGKPVVCVQSENEALSVLAQIKSGAGGKASEITFKQDVVVARAPRDANPVSRHIAMRVLRGAVSPVVERWAVLVNGRPVVAVPSRTAAGEVLDLAKLRFGKMVENLAEEPQFKENVTVQMVPVSPSIYFKTASAALDYLYKPKAPKTSEGVYTVQSGDLAGEIAERHGLKLAELEERNPGVTLDRLQIGDKIRVRKSKAPEARLTVVVRDQSDVVDSIEPPVQRVSSSQLYAGRSKVIAPGVAGKRKATIATIYENGHRVGSEVTREEVIREPIPRRLAVGIRSGN